MDNLSTLVGERIRRLRKQKDMFQAELGDKAGIPVRTIGRIERGEVDVRLGTLKKIADALGMTVRDLV